MIITIVLDNNTSFLAVCRNIIAGNTVGELLVLESGAITNGAANGVEVWLSRELLPSILTAWHLGQTTKPVDSVSMAEPQPIQIMTW